MKLIKNNIIPFGGFKAINLFGILFYKGNAPSEKVINHEAIHTALMKELLYIFFYIWYLFEWLIKFIYYGGLHKAYKQVSFEKEAYKYEKDLNYLIYRKNYSWLHMNC